jgi:release factor glutamine methyltransferase
VLSAGEALQAARMRLAGVSQNPRLDAEVLLAHVLQWPRSRLFAHPGHLLSSEQADRFEQFLIRRLAAEPLQYILGVQEFFGLPFAVSPDVLIPRPETEHLVEAVLERFGREAHPHIADVGTGSGIIAVVLAHRIPRARITAIDSSVAALEVARRNARQHGVAPRLDFLEADLLTGLEEKSFDAVVSNPPYIANAEVLERQVLDYEPHAALFAGPTGLEAYQRLIPQARKVLRPGGWLVLEIGHGQQAALNNLLKDWENLRFLPDLQGIPRVVEARLLK